MEVRLIVDPAAPGDWNMAVDEALLESAGRRGLITLRFYTWQRPTLSLGYFQELQQRAQHEASTDCPVVRRASGGGAILHDRELTYSFCSPSDRSPARSVQQLYDAFHETLVDTLAELGVAAGLHRESATSARGSEPFLCFQRRAAGDVVAAGDKLAGSAQRRSHHAVLQHGSVLLSRSPWAPELAGLEQHRGRPLDAAQLRASWSARLAARLRCRWVAAGPDEAELAAAQRFRAEKFASPRWTGRR